jgi:hypothetical protein
MRAVIPGDVKGEYTALITALGGSVWHIGRGPHALNPLDAGPLRTAIATAPATDRTRLIETLRARRLSLLEALISIVRHDEPDVTERRLLGIALDIAVDAAHRREPLIPDVLTVLLSAAHPLQVIAASADDSDYRRLTRSLTNALGLLCEGAIRGIFDVQARQAAGGCRLRRPQLALPVLRVASFGCRELPEDLSTFSGLSVRQPGE